MDMLGIKESLDRMAKASSMQWYGHVLRKEDENTIVKALEWAVVEEEEDRNKRGKSK